MKKIVDSALILNYINHFRGYEQYRIENAVFEEPFPFHFFSDPKKRLDLIKLFKSDVKQDTKADLIQKQTKGIPPQTHKSAILFLLAYFGHSMHNDDIVKFLAAENGQMGKLVSGWIEKYRSVLVDPFSEYHKQFWPGIINIMMNLRHLFKYAVGGWLHVSADKDDDLRKGKQEKMAKRMAMIFVYNCYIRLGEPLHQFYEYLMEKIELKITYSEHYNVLALVRLWGVLGILNKFDQARLLGPNHNRSWAYPNYTPKDLDKINFINNTSEIYTILKGKIHQKDALNAARHTEFINNNYDISSRGFSEVVSIINRLVNIYK
jgi:hypothetical protein